MIKNTEATNSKFDYIIIGAGVAGLQLAMAMSNNSYFSKKRIAIIDPSKKNIDDKTFCFWEKTPGKWDHIVSKQWTKTFFFDTNNKKLKIDLFPYTYKKIKSIDFYNYSIRQLKNEKQFYFLTEEISSVSEKNDSVTITTTNNFSIKCSHLFDSRIPKEYIYNKSKYAHVNQSFYGFVIETDKPVFDKNIFTMMDYRLNWKSSTSFMYLLPKSKNEALIEYTFFAPFTITKQQFENQIKNYVNNYYPHVKYSIKSKEIGTIPMSSYPFEIHNTNKITKIGTAGGWLKASSGYSFKRSEKYVSAIIEQLICNKKVIGYKAPVRFKFYDRLLLRILQNNNKKGPDIFYKMYKNINPIVFFKFLDEETNLIEEISLILKLPYFPFIKALFNFK